MDNTRGEPPFWKPEDVRSSDWRAVVEEATGASVTLRLDGAALLATRADLDKAERGFDARALGYVHYDAFRKVIDRFELVAVGDHWGQGTFTGRARPGKTPLGVAFELAPPDAADAAVPPQGARELSEYFGKRP